MVDIFMSHVGFHVGSTGNAGGGGGGVGGRGGPGGGGGGSGRGGGEQGVLEYTTQSMLGTVLLQPILWLIQWMLGGPRPPLLQSERTSKAEQRGSLLQLPLPCFTQSTAVAHTPVDRVAPALQVQCPATHPEAETQDPVVRTNPCGAAGQVSSTSSGAAAAVTTAASSSDIGAALRILGRTRRS